MGDRRRRRQRSDASSEDEEEEKEVWSATESEKDSDSDAEAAGKSSESPKDAVPGVEDEAEAELEHLTEDNITPEVEVDSADKDEIRSPEESPEESGSSSEGEGEESGSASETVEKSDEENPTYVPRKGNFYEHDDRNFEESASTNGPRGKDSDGWGREQHTDATGRVWGGKKEKKWAHDMYNEDEQKPKEEWEREKTRREDRGRGGHGRGDGRPQKHEYQNEEQNESRYRRTNMNEEPVNKEDTSVEKDNNERPRRGSGRGTGPTRGRRECEYKPFVVEQKEAQDQNNEAEATADKKDPEDYPTPLSVVERGGYRRREGDRGGRRNAHPPEVNNEEDYPELRESRPVDKRRRGGSNRGRSGYRRQEDEEEEEEEEKYDRSENVDKIQYDRRSNRGRGREQRQVREEKIDEDDIYEDAPEDLGDKKSSRVRRRPNERGQEEMWRQIEQLKLSLEQVAQGQQVLGQGSQQTVVGKGRSRPHTRTSPNQDSLIYKIAQEKAQELAANPSSRYMSHATSPPESPDSEDEADRNMAPPPPPIPRQPKFKSSTVQTEGEVITMKPKRYSQRSKTLDPNLLREKMLMSMEDYAQNQYAQAPAPGYSQLPFNPYAAEFHTPPDQQDTTFSEAQLQQMLLLQRMAQSYQPPPQPHHEYTQQAQQQMQANMMLQQQAAMLNSYVPSIPSVTRHMTENSTVPAEMLSPSQQLKRSKAIPIVDPNNMLHITQVIHEP